MNAADLLEQIRQLPENERREVVQQILDEFTEFDDELTPEQIAELERRADELQKHPERGIPWEQVRADARKKFGWD
jgi:putative addiction module component (TIGR02574 family)